MIIVEKNIIPNGVFMKKIIFVLFTITNICLGLISCSSVDSSNNSDNNQESSVNTENNSNSSSNTDNNTNNYPSLKIVCDYSGCITRVGLVGYSFDDLRILNNESKTFELINGIPGGYENVNVNVKFSPAKVVNGTHTTDLSSIKCNFTKGETTTITLTNGCTLSVSY